MRLNAMFLTLTLAAGLALAGCETTHYTSNERAVSDSTITANVKAALVQDPETRASNISVNTLDGTVELSGFVNTPGESHEADRIASNVAGVHSVKNRLQVNDQGPAVASANDDAVITNRVEAALAANPNTGASQIKVSTSDGVVDLAGFVNSNEQRDNAVSVTRSVPGVRSVDNDLRLAPGE